MSDKPIRVQLSRKKGWRMPPNTRKVDRSTPWGNPFNATQHAVAFMNQIYVIPCLTLRTAPSLDRCLDMFVAYAKGRLAADPRWLEPLRGMNLGCWCVEGAPCHADHLLRLANELAPFPA